MREKDGAGRHAIVVGAGLAGLTTGYRLKQAGWQVTVLEREEQPGGRTTTFQKNGYVVDACATAISSTYVEYMELIKEVGLSDALVDTSNIFGIYRHGKVHEIEALKPLRTFITADWMSASEKLGFIRGALKLSKYMRGVTIADPGDSIQYDHLTIGDIARKLFGHEITDNLLDPMIRLFTFGDFNKTTSVEFFTGLVGAKGRYINIRSGIDSLPKALSRHSDLIVGAEVTSVLKRDNKVQVSFDQAGSRRTLSGDVCVLTCPFAASVRLYPELGARAPLLAQRNEIAASYVVHLGYAVPTRTQAAVIALPRRDYPNNICLFLDHNKAPDRAPKGHSLFDILYTPEASASMRDWSEDAVVQDACKFVESLCPEVQGHLDMSNVKWVSHVCHMASPGYFAAVQQLHAHQPANDRIQLAGDYFSLPGQETAVGWGNRAAQRIIQNFG